MTNLSQTAVSWTDQRIAHMLKAPRMWGSAESVEMQILQLLEMRALALRPQQELENPRRVLDMYAAFLRERFPESPPRPLFRIIVDAENEQFGGTLRDFAAILTQTILAENPFEHSQLAIKLTFDTGRQPTTSAFTGYYEEFRRATRALTRGNKVTGRAKKDIEGATDFVMEDAIVSPANGVAGEVLLRLGTGAGQRNWEADERVRDGLSTVLTLAEWASTGNAVAKLDLDDGELRARTAVQARRLVPRRGIQRVEVGGKLVARSKPVEILAEHDFRFLEVIGAEAREETFDEWEEIRALDLDRGLLVLGRQRRLHCFVRPEHLGGISEVGVKAHVVGRLYRPLWGNMFVLADSVEMERSAVDD